MRKWIIEHFLPMWAKETVLAENRSLRAENVRLRRENRRLEAYIQGLENGIRAGRRVNIYNKGGKE